MRRRVLSWKGMPGFILIMDRWPMELISRGVLNLLLPVFLFMITRLIFGRYCDSILFLHKIQLFKRKYYVKFLKEK
jgi:hypothetical protein